jgi:hypothetical protein
MKLKQLSQIALFFSVALLSCQKQIDLNGSANGGTNNSLAGNYDFVNIRVKATVTANTTESGLPVKAVTLSDYTSKNNQGTAIFDAVNFSALDFAYLVDTVVITNFYAAGLLVDTQEIPFNVAIPAYNGSSPYAKNGADSLTFQSAVVNAPGGSGVSMPNGPSGAKYSWSGNLLTLKSAFNFSNTQELNGSTINLQYEGTQWLTLKKK